MSFLFVVNRLDALIKRIEQLISAVTGKPVEELPPVELPPPTVVMPQLPNRYKIFEVDLSVARPEPGVAIGVKEMLVGANSPYVSFMSIITVPAAYKFKLNVNSEDAIDATVGAEISDFEITEIFIVNDALAGTALIYVEYRVD